MTRALRSTYSLYLLMTLTLHTTCSSTCPSRCKCSQTKLDNMGEIYKVVCSDQNLQEIPDLSVLKSVSLPIHLYLNENEIKSVTDLDFPSGLNIDSLDLSRNKDISIESEAFKHLSTSLTKLSLEAINLNFDTPFNIVSGLGRLRELSISHNNRKGYVAGAVEKVVVTLFSGPVARSLRVLRMSHCGMRSLVDDTFKHLTYLEELDLSNNWFYEVPNAIRSLRNLKKLVLVRCNIKSIKDDTFLGMSKLSWLELNRCPIETIERFAFRGLENSLKKMSLELCHLKTIPSKQIKHLKELECLDLTANHFESAPAYSFDGEYCLKTLLISGPHLQFESDTFIGQNDCIVELTIKQMNLNTIPKEALSQLNKLQFLTLERVGLTSLPPAALDGIKAKTISLAENDLTSIAPGAFLGLVEKVELNLRKTKVSDIDFLLGYEDDAIATVNLDKTELHCRCSMESSLNATLNIAIFGACIKNNKTTIPFDSFMLKSVLNEACEEEKLRNSVTSTYGLVSLEFVAFLYVLTYYMTNTCVGS